MYNPSQRYKEKKKQIFLRCIIMHENQNLITDISTNILTHSLSNIFQQ